MESVQLALTLLHRVIGLITLEEKDLAYLGFSTQTILVQLESAQQHLQEGIAKNG